MDKRKKYDDLAVLALSLGFHGMLDEQKRMWLTTKYQGQPVPILLTPDAEDLFGGRADLVLKIVDERLGINSTSKDLTLRFNKLNEIYNSEDHPFWDKAKK